MVKLLGEKEQVENEKIIQSKSLFARENVARLAIEFKPEWASSFPWVIREFGNAIFQKTNQSSDFSSGFETEVSTQERLEIRQKNILEKTVGGRDLFFEG